MVKKAVTGIAKLLADGAPTVESPQQLIFLDDSHIPLLRPASSLVWRDVPTLDLCTSTHLQSQGLHFVRPDLHSCLEHASTGDAFQECFGLSRLSDLVMERRIRVAEDGDADDDHVDIDPSPASGLLKAHIITLHRVRAGSARNTCRPGRVRAAAASSKGAAACAPKRGPPLLPRALHGLILDTTRTPLAAVNRPKCNSDAAGGHGRACICLC